jgi:hypothetical protein
MSTLQAPSKALDRDRRVAERADRLKQLEFESTQRRIAQIAATVADFARTVDVLELAIRMEQNQTKIHDPGHIAYSNSARAMIHRRDNLRRSIHELKRQLPDTVVGG